MTQRSAVLNKNVLTQAQMLVALRTIAPQDLAAMNAWVDVHGTEEQKRTLMESLPSLPIGDAWFWSPGWPTTEGIFQRVHVLPIETFDSGATPKAGEKRIEPKQAADVDLDALKRQMAATIEKAKADDPRELRKQIAELKKQLSSTPVTLPTERQAASTPVLTDADRARLEKLSTSIEQAASLMHEDLVLAGERVKSQLELVAGEYVTLVIETASRAENALKAQLSKVSIQKILGKLATVPAPPPIHPTTPPSAPRSPQARRVAPAPATSRPARLVSPNGDRSVGNSGLRRMLIALAQRPNGLTRAQVGIRAGLSPRTGTFATYLGKMRSSGWVADAGETIRITEAGLEALGEFTPLPEGEDLAAYWIHELGGGAGRMLQAIVNAYPNTLSREALGQAANLSEKTGTFATYLGKLRGLELVSSRGEIRASEELFS